MFFLLVLITGNSWAQENPVKDMLTELLNSNEKPDWKSVQAEFEKEHSNRDADSLRACTKMEYYNEKNDRKKYAALLIDYESKYGKNWTPQERNSYAWMLFKYSKNPLELQTALEWSKQSFSQEETKDNPHFLDTYANLLYKLGKRNKALGYEGKVFFLFSGTEPYLDSKTGGVSYGLNKKRAMTTLFKMEKGEPTWPVSIRKGTKSLGIAITGDAKYWQRVKKKWLLPEYSKREADSILFLGKLEYYNQKENNPTYIREFIAYMEKYGNRTLQQKNENAWNVFLYSENPKQLKKALSWSEETIKDSSSRYHCTCLHTYANILYKLGNKTKAIKYINKALERCPEDDKEVFHFSLEKIKKNEKTWK